MGTHEDLQTLRLLKAFIKITDPDVRRWIMDYVEAQVPPDRTETTKTEPTKTEPTDRS